MQASLTKAWIMCVAFGLSLAAAAQNPPGSDPIVISGKVTFTPLPLKNPGVTSKPLDPSTNLPPELQAKIARFEADAYNTLGTGSGVIQTGKDVVSVQTGNALQRTCTTNVASNAAAPPIGAAGPNPNAAGPQGQFGIGSRDQIAVLQGDLVTICK